MGAKSFRQSKRFIDDSRVEELILLKNSRSPFDKAQGERGGD